MEMATTMQTKGEKTVEISSFDDCDTMVDNNVNVVSESTVTNSRSKKEINDEHTSSSSNSKRPSDMRHRRMSRQLSQSLEPLKPETPIGWTAFMTSLASLLVLHEMRLQKKLTCPPKVYTQDTPFMNTLRETLTQNSKDGLSILNRNIQPSLFVGTRSVLASTAAYVLYPKHTSKKRQLVDHVTRFREVIKMESDGATIALDWELPIELHPSSVNRRTSKSDRIANVKYGPICQPVVIILHGINNDATFGYIRSLMRSCTDRGWIACGVNFRGTGNVQLTTPRGYNAGYTGDLRSIVQKIQSRLSDMENTPIFLVGNSLGANIMTKYLGEEGYSGTLPKCVKGSVSLGNPLRIHSGDVHFPWNMALGMGVKKIFAENWKTMHSMSNCFHFRKAVKNAMLSPTIGQLDDSMSPFLIKNDSHFPFSTKIGYIDGEDYWYDSSSSRFIQHVSVPLLVLSSQDDFLVADSVLNSLSKCVCNPNVIVVKTKFGGHLGWQEAPPSGTFRIGKSWADTAMSDFCASVLETNQKYYSDSNKKRNKSDVEYPTVANMVESMYSSKQFRAKL